MKGIQEGHYQQYLLHIHHLITLLQVVNSSVIYIIIWTSTIRTMKRSLSMWGWVDAAIIRRTRRRFAIFMSICLWWKDRSYFIIATVPSSLLNINEINSWNWKSPLIEYLRQRVCIIQRIWVSNLVGLGFKRNNSFPLKTWSNYWRTHVENDISHQRVFIFTRGGREPM